MSGKPEKSVDFIPRICGAEISRHQKQIQKLQIIVELVIHRLDIRIIAVGILGLNTLVVETDPIDPRKWELESTHRQIVLPLYR